MVEYYPVCVNSSSSAVEKDCTSVNLSPFDGSFGRIEKRSNDGRDRRRSISARRCVFFFFCYLLSLSLSLSLSVFIF